MQQVHSTLTFKSQSKICDTLDDDCYFDMTITISYKGGRRGRSGSTFACTGPHFSSGHGHAQVTSLCHVKTAVRGEEPHPPRGPPGNAEHGGSRLRGQ